MNNDNSVELGLGFYVIIIPLVLMLGSLVIQLFVMPRLYRLQDKMRQQNFELSRIVKWIVGKF